MNPVLNQIKGVFIPVSNVRDARDWYCDLLGLSPSGEIFFDHIYVVPMQGTTDIVLDSKIFSPQNIYNHPVLQLVTDNIELSYQYLQSKKVEVITEVQNGHWFNIKDPDGNVLMICDSKL